MEIRSLYDIVFNYMSLYRNNWDKTTLIDVPLMVVCATDILWQELTTFLSTHPVPQGVISGLNIVLWATALFDWPTRIDNLIDSISER